MMKRIRKGLTLERVEEAVRLTKQAGIKVGANFIIGHPDETWETAMQTITSRSDSTPMSTRSG